MAFDLSTAKPYSVGFDLSTARPVQQERSKPFDYRTFAQEEARRQGVDPALVLKVIDAESGGKADAVSRAGARGLMQLMPDTAKELGVDPNDPQQNIIGGIRYLKQQLDEFKSPELALAAYNSGPGTVRKSGNRVPAIPETMSYVSKITGKSLPASEHMRASLQKAPWLERQLVGIGGAMVGGIEGLRGLVGQSNPEDIEFTNVAQEEAPIGSIVGNIAMMAPTMAIPGVNTVGGATAVGGLYNALVTPGSISDRKNAAVMGALGGGAGQAVSNALSRAFIPTRTAQNALKGEGITLTPGQYAGGFWKDMEDKLTSVPGIGNVINNARTRGIEEFNEAAIRRATVPGMRVDGVGNQAIQDVRLGLSDAYDKALASASIDGLDPVFQTNMVQLAKNVADGLPAQEFDMFRKIISRELVERMAPNGKINGENLQMVTSALGDKAALFSKSNDAYQRQLGEALLQASEELRGAVTRQNPALADELKGIDKAYAHFKRLQNAASGVGAEDGVFTPAQLHRASKALDKTKDKRAFSEGTALYQDLTKAGKSVMPSKVPDSGTAGRMFANLFSLKGATSTALGGAAAVPAMALYSKTGSRMANALYDAISSQNYPNAIRLVTGPALTQQLE